ncbi:hypothetical protein CP863_07430 [Cutibacterium acnes]|nr:hypothetical protein CP863_07430 [Cutibacterium acnes]
MARPSPHQADWTHRSWEEPPVSNQNTSSVIFVCWGNICRSPMAEFVARKVFSDEGFGRPHHQRRCQR